MRHVSQFIKGTLILTAAGLLSRCLGFFYKIFLAQALGAEGMGIYQLIFPVFSVCHALTSSGIEISISRFTAFAKKEDKSAYLYTGLSLSLTASLLVGLLLWQHSGFISIALLHEARCTPLLRILAVAVPLSTIHACFAGSYLGQKRTGIPAIAQLLEQTIRIGTVWLLCHITVSQNQDITPSLAVFGLLTGEACSVLFMLTVTSSRLPHPFSFQKYIKNCKTLLQMAVPITGTRLSLTLLQSAEAVLIPLNLQKHGLSSTEALSLYGILTGMSLSFLMFPNAVTSSISAMLLPTISKEQASGNDKRIAFTIEHTIQFGLMIGILCMGIFLCFGEKLGTIVFHEVLAGHFLTTLAWICPILYLTGNLNSILNGLGKTSVTFFNQLAAILVRILFILLFTPSHGIQGVLWGLLASQFLLCLLGFRALRPYLQLTKRLDALVWRPLAAILLSIGSYELLSYLFPAFSLPIALFELAFRVFLVAGMYFLFLIFFRGYRLQ